MGKITQTALPDQSLLHALAAETGAYADCFEATVASDARPGDAFTRFVFLFFDSPVFRLERVILRVAGKAPPDQTNPKALAQSQTDQFAVWRVQQRKDTEILLTVPDTPIRTWLSLTSEGGTARLRFGSAILPQGGRDAPHWAYRVTIGAHRLYARLLLRAAISDWVRGKTLSD